MELKMLLNKKIDLLTCDLTKEQIDKLIQNKIKEIRMIVAQRSDLNEEQINKLSVDICAYVRATIKKTILSNK